MADMHPAVMAYLTDDVPRKLSWEKPKVEPKPEEVAPPKRKRGRPRKVAADVDAG